jgi:dihydrofolate synthase/folylpolyglutamate synthase
MKFGLQGIRTLLKFLDHPENQFPSIHVAGTNGKGSTASMIAAIFTAAGYKTGLTLHRILSGLMNESASTVT